MAYGTSTQIPLIKASHMAKFYINKTREYIFLPSYRAMGRDEGSSFRVEKKIGNKHIIYIELITKQCDEYEICLDHINQII